MKNYLILLFCLLTTGSLQAQDAVVFYDVNQESTEISYYMQSKSEQPLDIAAVNLSIALPEGCVVKKTEAMFEDSWTSYLERSTALKGLDLEYNAMTYSSRFQYGNADPALPSTSLITIPSTEDQPLLVATFSLKGNCDQLVAENATANSLNQIAGSDFTEINYELKPLKKDQIEMALQIKMLPNPVQQTGRLSVLGAEAGNYNLQMTDALGKTLFVRSYEIDVQTEISVDMSELAQGVYTLELRHSHNTDLRKTIKVVRQ